ncbi:autotransporter outer membrane beta-barrel domain-containing protein, partial [Rhizobiaceae sp. 2RAB30]
KADRIVASGKANIAGGKVEVLAGSGQFSLTSNYSILKATGGTHGRFSSVTSNLAFLTPSLVYGKTEISLKLDRNDVAFESIGTTRNQIAIGRIAEPLGAGNKVYDAIVKLDAPTARRAFDALSGEMHASVSGMLVEDSRFLRDAATDRIRAAFGQAGRSAVPVMAYGDNGLEAVDATSERFAFWGQAFGSWGSMDGDGNAAAFDRTIGGFIGGADTALGDAWRLGLLGGYSNTSFDVTDRASSGSANAYHVGVYGGGQWGGIGLRGGAAYSWSDIKTGRTVAFGGFSDSLSADYSAGTAQAFGEFGYRMNAAGFAFEPFAGLAYVGVDADGFTETGGAAALTGAGDRMDTTFSTIGLRAQSGFTIGSVTGSFSTMLGWRHAFGDVTPGLDVAFSQGAFVSVSGVPIARDAAVIDAGLDFDLGRDASLGFSYSGQFGSGAQDHSAKANFSLRF